MLRYSRRLAASSDGKCLLTLENFYYILVSVIVHTIQLLIVMYEF